MSGKQSNDAKRDSPAVPSLDAIARGRLCDRGSLAAGVIYLAASVVLFGRALFSNASHSYVGRASDPSLIIWSIAWWRYSISQGLNPFLTNTIFAPKGINLAWMLIAMPILFARFHWREPFGQVLVGLLVIVCLLALGPILQIGGHRLNPMPGLILTKMPLVNKAVPARFMMFDVCLPDSRGDYRPMARVE